LAELEILEIVAFFFSGFSWAWNDWNEMFISFNHWWLYACTTERVFRYLDFLDLKVEGRSNGDMHSSIIHMIGEY